MANPSQSKNVPGFANSNASTPIASTSGVSADNYTNPWNVLVLTFSNWVVTIPDATAYVGVQIADFPEGIISIGGCVGRITITTTSVLASTLNASVTLAWSVGTVTASNVTLSSTMADIIPSTAATSSATINVANTATVGSATAFSVFDGSATAKDAYFNISVPTATDIDADATVAINGKILLRYLTHFDV